MVMIDECHKAGRPPRAWGVRQALRDVLTHRGDTPTRVGEHTC